MSDIAYKVIVNNNGTDDIIFKTIMLKGSNGTSISSIEKTSTSGNVDTYTIYLDDGTVGGTFTVTNSDASSLSSLTDVTLSGLTGGQALIYDGSTGKWKNTDIAQSIADQTDVDISSLADGDSLVYDSTAGKWKNEALPDELTELGDVDISSAQSGDALLFDSVAGKWKNGTPAQSLAGLDDVNVASAQDGNVLAYDQATGKWKNEAVSIAQSLDDLTDVDITSATAGQALIYDADSGEWKNGSVSTVGSLDDLTDVSISSAQTGESLRYDGSGWVNAQTTIECTQAQYDAWKSATPSQLKSNTMYVIKDGANLNATANDLSMGSAPYASGSVGKAITDINTRLGSRLVGAWTADSSNANNTYLTDEITVGAGTYLIVMSYPDISTTTFVASLYNKTTSAVYDNCYMLANSLGTKCVLTAFSATGKICVASAQSGACTFTNKARGGIRAIKLSDNY